jgi:3-oxoacyl-[acyl-carrier-protein] synthase II
MALRQEIVITGMGVVSPIGIGGAAFAAALDQRRSGVRRLGWWDDFDLPAPFGGQVDDFDPKQYVRPRKSLKVMSRDIQFAFAAADMAFREAGLGQGQVDPERIGVIFGAQLIPSALEDLVPAYRACVVDGRFDFRLWGEKALPEMFPLWMLKYLPNMPACHVGIALDARGPNNTLTLGDTSSLAAVCEAVRVLERGQAEAIITGGCGSNIHPATWTVLEKFQLSRRGDNPPAACRPFDTGRDGMVRGEGAAAFLVETRAAAEARGAKPLARVAGFAIGFEPHPSSRPLAGTAIRRAIAGALADAGLSPDRIGHVNAHGKSTTFDDRIEAQAIRDTLGDAPVTAPKSYFGDLGAGGGAVEMVASVVALQGGQVPVTLNYETPDPECPINVVHGKPLAGREPTALVLSHTWSGQAAAVVLAAE